MVLEERERAGERASIPTPRANRKRFLFLHKTLSLMMNVNKYFASWNNFNVVVSPLFLDAQLMSSDHCF